MKMLTIAVLFTSPLLAQETHFELPSSPVDQKILIDPIDAERTSLFYIKMEGSDSVNSLNVVIPGLGLGWRVYGDSSAVDISFSGNYRKDNDRKVFQFYTFPKANYYYYLNGDKNNSLYVGGGAAWGFVENSNKKFHGLISNLVLGYEMNRQRSVGAFVQLDISQPSIPASIKNGMPGPIAELSVGAGF